ncbi:MAG: thioredoxin-disulfide reductase [Candidatus Altiarchaeales archaeon ex4484_96]|nr:MAG: thioredoxin-disulfide reductase [Candidatus Altiarchaeales archaeon ex4484_96]
MVYDVVVIGGGPAGCTAALYAKRSGLKTLLIEKGIIGGYIVNARSLENYPGFSSISGMDFGSKLSEQLKGFDVELMPDEVVQLSLKGEIKEVSTREKKIQTKTVILASGTEHRKLGIKGEAEFIGRGVSFCATCDAPFYRDRKVAVIGGGNSAVDEALTLSEMASTVYLIHRRDMLRAEQVRCEQLAEKGVKILYDTELTQIKGDKMVDSVMLVNNKTKQKSELDVDGVFIAVGYVPSTLIAQEAGVNLNGTGYVIVDESQKTNVDGVYAAGDVTGGVLQVATAVGEGAIAGVSVFNYLRKPYWSRL